MRDRAGPVYRRYHGSVLAALLAAKAGAVPTGASSTAAWNGRNTLPGCAAKRKQPVQRRAELRAQAIEARIGNWYEIIYL